MTIEREARERADEEQASAIRVSIDALPLPEYLAKVAGGHPAGRSATGKEIADALRRMTRGYAATYDLKGTHVVGHKGSQWHLLLADGTLVLEDKAKRFGKRNVVHPSDYRYLPEETATLMRGGASYHRGIQGEGSF